MGQVTTLLSMRKSGIYLFPCLQLRMSGYGHDAMVTATMKSMAKREKKQKRWKKRNWIIVKNQCSYRYTGSRLKQNWENQVVFITTNWRKSKLSWLVSSVNGLLQWKPNFIGFSSKTSSSHENSCLTPPALNPRFSRK